MMKTWSKTWNELITDMTPTKKSDGLSSGRVIFQKRADRPAPSSSAAS
jgi:hypothetical protein